LTGVRGKWEIESTVSFVTFRHFQRHDDN